jgi:hypothetical protein
LKANTDTSVSTTVTLPTTSEAVGPFSIITRYSQYGQIIDANYVFACIAVASASTTSSMTVTAVSGTTGQIVNTSDGLYFTFVLTQNLWMHDIIKIVPDTTWTSPTKPTCSSVTVTDNSNLLTGPAGDHSLPCAADSKGVIYIYGLNNDVMLDGAASLKIQISVATFTLPAAAYSSSAFSWSLSLWRWGTNTLLTTYSATTGPYTVLNGSITVSSWTPVGTIPAANVVSGMTLFTTLTFTTKNKISAGGSITVTFGSTVDISNDWWIEIDKSAGSGELCFLSTYISGTTCTVTSSALTIAFTNAQPAGTISVVTNTAFSGTPATVSSIVSQTSSSIYVDKSSGTASSWTLSGTYNILTDYQFFGQTAKTVADTVGLQTGGFYTDRYLTFAVSPKSTTWTASTSVVVTLPFSTIGIQLLTPYIASTFLATSILEITDSTLVGAEVAASTNTYAIGTNTITCTTKS